MCNINAIIQELELKPHPEGGYYKETYRSKEIISEACLANQYKGERSISTAIYFLLTSDNFSAFHKINQDEFWHFYKGSPILLHQISPEGEYTRVTVGNDIEKKQIPQYYVPAGYWFAAEVLDKNSYALVGCTVAPGFDFSDFVLAERNDLIKLFPIYKNVITRLTR